MLKEEHKHFIEYNLSSFLGACAAFLISVLILPFIFQRVPEESLIRIVGHLSSLRVDEGNTPYASVFTFTVKEYPHRTFSVHGLRLVDQGLLTNWESFGGNFNLWVEDSEFNEKDSDIHVYGIYTSENVYLEVGNAAADSKKSRAFMIGLSLILFISSAVLTLRLRKRKAGSVTDVDADGFDPLVITFAEYPRVLVTGIFLILLVAGVSFSSQKVVIPFCGGLSFFYSLFLLWYKFWSSKLLWLNSIRERHRLKLEELSRRLATVAPKHFKAVQLLLKQGAKVNVQDGKGRTPLLIASAAGEVEAVALLLRNSASTEIADKQGNTPLMEAASRGHLGVIMKLLGAKARVSTENEKGITALALAEANTKNKTVVDVLSTALIKEKQLEERLAKLAAEKAAKKGLKDKGKVPGGSQNDPSNPPSPQDPQEPKD